MAPLSIYIAGALQALGVSKENIANAELDRLQSQLSSTRINYILRYNGCFNPPHVGHLRVLTHALHHSGHDLSPVAAILTFASENGLKAKYKYAKDEGPIGPILTREQRAALWMNHWECLGSKVWPCKFRLPLEIDFQRKVIKHTARDGFEVRFIGVCGPDHVQPFMSIYKGAPTLLNFVSDAGKKAWFLTEGSLLVVDGFTEWCMLEETEESLRDMESQSVELAERILSTPTLAKIRETNPQAFSDILNSATSDFQDFGEESLDKLYQAIGVASLNIRFLDSSSLLGPRQEVSSTIIRELLQNPETHRARLQGLALSADMLLDMLSHPKPNIMKELVTKILG